MRSDNLHGTFKVNVLNPDKIDFSYNTGIIINAFREHAMRKQICPVPVDRRIAGMKYFLPPTVIHSQVDILDKLVSRQRGKYIIDFIAIGRNNVRELIYGAVIYADIIARAAFIVIRIERGNIIASGQ